MIDVKEHFYDDDPSRGHADVRTRLKDASYFFLGNGLIQAAVQIFPSGEGTPVGLLIMDPERLAKKREALTMSHQSGLEHTLVHILSGKSSFTCRDGNVHACWTNADSVPAVHVSWRSMAFDVDEFFFCCELSKPVLVREVRVKNLQKRPATVLVKTGCLDCFVEKRVALKGGEEGLYWEAEARRLKQAFLADKRYGLVDEGRFIKRRSADGSVQKSIEALVEARLPDGVPRASCHRNPAQG